VILYLSEFKTAKAKKAKKDTPKGTGLFSGLDIKNLFACEPLVRFDFAVFYLDATG
jgi:hypothetical protein